jgi:hypothetical protein
MALALTKVLAALTSKVLALRQVLVVLLKVLAAKKTMAPAWAAAQRQPHAGSSWLHPRETEGQRL